MVRTKDVFKSYVGNGTVYRCSMWSVLSLRLTPLLARSQAWVSLIYFPPLLLGRCVQSL